jgi:hypothetical protein
MFLGLVQVIRVLLLVFFDPVEILKLVKIAADCGLTTADQFGQLLYTSLIPILVLRRVGVSV